MKRILILISIVAISASFTPFAKHTSKDKKAKAEKPTRIKPIKKLGLTFREPSEVIASTDTSKLFILADKAFLYETDTKGKMIRKSSISAYDIEGACIVGGKIYISDESLRQVLIVDEKTLKLDKTVMVNNQGPRNLGFESITHLPVANNFLMATEKSPCVFYQYTNDFTLINQFSIDGIKEVSAMTYHDNNLYVLSDEQATVFKINPADYSILKSWKVPVNNAEGISFNAQGQMMIVSDDMGKLFIFNNPNN